MIFGYVGINYKHADQDIRDQIAFTDNQKIDFMQQFQFCLLLYSQTWE